MAPCEMFWNPQGSPDWTGRQQVRVGVWGNGSPALPGPLVVVVWGRPARFQGLSPHPWWGGPQAGAVGDGL